MDSIVNYESDDGNLKLTKKSSSQNSSHSKEKRRNSSDDSSDVSKSPRDRSRKHLNEEVTKSSRNSSSPRKSSQKRSRSDKNKPHESRSDKHRQRSSSRDSDRHERKKRRTADRDDKKKHRQRSKDREKRGERSESRERDEHSSKDRNRDRSNELRKDRYRDEDRDRKRCGRRENERRYEDDRDYCRRREEPPHRNSSRNTSDSRSNSSSSNSSSAIRRAEVLNRTIERRANEKVQQLQKLGIEIPAIIQQQQHLKQIAQLKPLMSISTGVTGGGLSLNSTATSTDQTKIDNDNLTLNMSNFISPVLANAKYTEQMQKKKMIWGTKKTTTETTTNNKWEAAKFSQDSDGKMASKFLRLMGMKNAPATETATTDDAETGVQKREQMFTSMEKQYEIARQATHTMRGMGLGFGSQSRPC